MILTKKRSQSMFLNPRQPLIRPILRNSPSNQFYHQLEITMKKRNTHRIMQLLLKHQFRITNLVPLLRQILMATHNLPLHNKMIIQLIKQLLQIPSQHLNHPPIHLPRELPQQIPILHLLIMQLPTYYPHLTHNQQPITTQDGNHRGNSKQICLVAITIIRIQIPILIATCLVCSIKHSQQLIITTMC